MYYRQSKIINNSLRFFSTAGRIKKYHINNNIPCLEIYNPKQRNAISMSMIDQLCKEFDSNLDNVPRELHIKFSEASPVASAGFNFYQLETDKIRQGLDFLTSDHIACKALSSLSALSNICETSVFINSDIYGYGLVLASQCKNINVDNDTIKFAMPHMRIGIAFPTLPMFALLSHFGVALTCKLLVKPYLFYSQIVSEKEKLYSLSEKEKYSYEQNAIEDFLKIMPGQEIKICDEIFRPIDDRALNLRKMLELHALQMKLYLHYKKFDCVSDFELDKTETLRLSSVTTSLADSIELHRKNVSVINPKSDIL